MIFDYSKQIGKKMITKGHHKRCIHIEEIVYIESHGGLSVLFLNDASKVCEIKTLKYKQWQTHGMPWENCAGGFKRAAEVNIIQLSHK